MISKFLLWFGFLFSLVILPFGIFVAEKPKPMVLLFWAFVLVATGYKLLFKK